jgi:hypothetical protein
MFRFIRQLVQKLKKVPKVETQIPSSHSNGNTLVGCSAFSTNLLDGTFLLDAVMCQSNKKQKKPKQPYYSIDWDFNNCQKVSKCKQETKNKNNV